MSRLLVLAVLTLTLTGCTRPGDYPVTPDCAWIEYDNRSLDLEQAADRRHLWNDAITAEDIAIRWADHNFPHQPEWDNQCRQCVEKYFNGIAALHVVDASIVRQYSRRRDITFDSAVILSFGLFYSLAAYFVAGLIRRRFSPQESGFWIMAVSIAVGAAVVGVALGSLWSIILEGIRLNSGHLSFRMFRLPFRRHWPLLFAGCFIISSLVTIIRSRFDIPIRQKPSLEIYSR